jgi:hypothetical protein
MNGSVSFADRALIAETTARMLLEIEAVHFNAEKPFIFTSGWASPVYIDCRKLIAYPRLRRTLVDFACSTILREVGFESIDAAGVPGERPEVFAPARWLARERDVIPSLYHEGLRFQDPAARTLIGLLDGTRTRDAIAQALGGAVTSSAGRARLDDALQVLARKAVLVA